MKEIPLTKGKFALVDDVDYDYLMQWKWHHRKDDTVHGYAARCTLKKERLPNTRASTIYMHGALMKNKAGMVTDHIDGNGLNNQRHNLREVTRSHNALNRKKRTTGTSKYKGVYFVKSTGLWCARLRLDTKLIDGGCYAHEVDAAIAYNELSIKYHGKFGSLNKITSKSVINKVGEKS